MSGRKIVGSAAEGLISILYCEPPQAVSWNPRPRSKEWQCGRGGSRDGREVAEGQTGDEESQGRQLHKDRHGALAGGMCGGAATVKSSSVRELGSSSTANPHLHVEVMKTKCLLRNPV